MHGIQSDNVMSGTCMAVLCHLIITRDPSHMYKRVEQDFKVVDNGPDEVR